MSFSLDVKTELSGLIDSPRHCRAAEFTALYDFLGKTDDGKIKMESGIRLSLLTAAQLAKKLFGTDTEPFADRTLPGRRMYAACFEDVDGSIAEFIRAGQEKRLSLTKSSCCKRAYLRGAFLAAGTVSDPEKSYQAEINCKDEYMAGFIAGLLKDLHLDARINTKDRYFSVYIKDGEQVFDLLGLMGARVTLLKLENAKILKSMRENVNRQVNCETANINKTAEAAAHQIEDIRYIDSRIGISSLPNGLDELARVRLEYPEATLQELGQYLDPPVGKSGVNHRLRKLAQIAGSLRCKEEATQ